MKNYHHIIQSLKIATLALAALLLVACQTTSTSGSGSAIMCGKCKTVWVSRPVSFGVATKGGPAYVAYRNVKTMECPECESAVTTFFKTGSLKHHCAHCGGELTHCTTH